MKMSFPLFFNVPNEAVKPTEQKKAIMKTSFMVLSNVISAMPPIWMSVTTRPPTTAAGMQNFLRFLDLDTRKRPIARATAPMQRV